jgi:glycosyltransferase involved in cell wall biosynthesis
MINNSFDCRFINPGTSTTVDDIGRSSIKKFFRYLSIIWQVKKQILTQKPDLCYITPTSAGPGFYKDTLIIAVVKLFRVKTLFHYHNKGIRKKQEKFFDNLLYKFVFRNTDIILLSHHLYTDIEKYIPESRVHLCANGIPDIHDRIRKGLLKSKENGKAELLFLSNLIESKGIYILLEACSILKRKNLDFQCRIAGAPGDVSKMQLLSRIIADNLEDRVSYIGMKTGEDKQKLLGESEIFVLPTHYQNECMPLVLLEAMQHSLPVISTFEGAIPDVVDNGITGFLVPQKDVAALADKLELLINDAELRNKMGSAGRDKYEREFTLKKFENRMVEILQEVCGNGNR